MNTILDLLSALEPDETTTYFDKTSYLVSRPPPAAVMHELRANAITVPNPKWYKNKRGWSTLSLVVVGANQHAIELLDHLCERERYILNYAEPTLNLRFADEFGPNLLRQACDEYFVQDRIGRHERMYFDHGTSTGQRRPGRRFHWYDDRPHKLTGEPNVFKIEGRYQGAPALRRIRIYRPADLLTFDHIKFWKRNFKLCDVDIEHLGRYHENRLRGERRQKPLIDGGYNFDCGTGGILFTALAAETHNQQGRFTTQQLIKNYGKGPFIRPIDVSHLLAGLS